MPGPGSGSVPGQLCQGGSDHADVVPGDGGDDAENRATPVPMAIRVNMLSFRLRTEAEPRTKNGHPAQSTTGVAGTSWVHTESVGGRGGGSSR